MSMSTNSEDFGRLFARAKEGCPEALGELFTRYAARVQAVIHRRMARQLRGQLDSVDCAQDVWLTLLKRSLTHLRFPDEQAFLRYLTQIALNKLGEQYRIRTTLKNDVSREECIFPATEPPARTPTVSQAAIAGEQWERLAAGLPPAKRQVLELLRSGCTYAEISQQLGINQRTVQRLLDQLLPRTGTES